MTKTEIMGEEEVVQHSSNNISHIEYWKRKLTGNI